MSDTTAHDPAFLALAEDPGRNRVIPPLGELAEGAVGKQTGVAGIALKGGLKAAKAVRENIVEETVRRLLPEIISSLAPQWDEYKEAGTEGGFGQHLENNSEATVSALLEVSDRNAESASSNTLKKLYASARTRAESVLTPEISEVGRILEEGVEA